MNNPNEINQERRCQVGLHNFPNYDSEDDIRVCKRCTAIELPYQELTDMEQQIVDSFKKIHFGHGRSGRDGTINYNKTW